MITFAQGVRLWLASHLIVLLFGFSDRAVAEYINITMPYGIGPLDYNGTTHRISWLSGRGRCGGEVPSPATLSMNSPFNLTSARADTGVSCNGTPESLVSDEAFIYFTQGGWLWRMPIAAPADTPAVQLPLGVSAGFTPAAVALAGNDLFWIESNGTFSKLWKAGGPGTNVQQLLLTGNFGPVHKLRVFYDTGSFHFPLTCCFLGDNGNLWKVVLDPVGPPTLLASGVKDFDLRVEGGGGQVLPFYRVFAMKNTQAVAIHLNLLSSTVIYPVGPPAPDNTLAAIAVDNRRVYLLENFPQSCDPFICAAYHVLRQERPLDDSTVRPWTLFGQATDNEIVQPRNLFATGPLYSYGSFLIWSDGNTMRSINADAPPISLNLRALGVEIVQAIQNLDNTVPLVMGKHTYVRAYAAADFNTTGNPNFLPKGVLNVSARFVPLQSFTPLGTLNTKKGVLVDSNVDLSVLRSDVSKSYLFELPEAWTYYPELQCEFVVNPNHAFTENFGFDPYGDDSATGHAVFIAVPEQCWVFVAVKTVPNTYFPQAERYSPGFWNIIERAKSMLPMNKVNVETWPDLIGPVFSTGDAKFELKNSGDWANARAALACWTIGRSRPCVCTRYIGTVHPTAGMGSKTSGIGGTRPFFANSSVVRMEQICSTPFDCPRGGEVLAHELAHNFGRAHVNCGKPEGIDWQYPYPPCTMTIPNLQSPSAHFGFDPLSLSAINPGANGDMMSYFATTWPSDYTWNGILFSGEFCYPNFGGRMQAMALEVRSEGSGPGSILILSGSVDHESNRVSLFPSFVVPEGIFNNMLRASGGAAGGNQSYTFRLVDGSGGALSEGPLVLEESDGNTSVNLFVQTMAAPQGLAGLQILRNGEVRAERYVTPHAPSVSLTAPMVDSSTHILQCDWSGSDADGDRLAYSVQYSTDDGDSWIPLQMANPNTALRLDTREIAGSPQARLRVIATDGLQCAIATSDPFAVPNNPPAAVILGLNEGDRIAFGQATPVTGIGHDLEDGMLEGEHLQWDVTGPRPHPWSGEHISLAGLTPGNYTATLTAIDNAGLSASNSLHFEVLPLSVPDRPAPAIDGLVADDAYVGALEITFSSGAQESRVRLSHSEGYLNIAFSDLPFSPFGSPLSAGIVFDTNATQHTLPQRSEVGFYIDETGIPAQRNGDGSAMVLNLQPALGVRSAIFRQGNAWSAELQIPDSLLGGWGHRAALLINVRDEANVTALTWPSDASTAYPASWAPALFGVSVASSNRPPVAITQGPRVIRAVPGQVISLDGSKSFDPDGQPLTYQWTQLSGPAVTLSNPISALPSFVAPDGNPVTLQFRLVVNDAFQTSAPSEIGLTIYSIALNPQPFPPVGAPSSPSSPANGAMSWPGLMGDRAVIDASVDLKVWIPIVTNTVDSDGLVHFRDPNAGLYPWRFYRARGLSSINSIVYSNDFEGVIGPEWSATVADITPVGNRRFLGQFGQQNVSLTLASLPAHGVLKVRCDLFVIGPWDGNSAERGGPDVWQLLVRNGATLLDATFSSYFSQSYPGNRFDSFPPRTNADENDTLGYSRPGFGGGDSVYHIEFTFDHQNSSLILDFNGLGLQTFGNQTWGIDNIQIESIYNP